MVLPYSKEYYLPSMSAKEKSLDFIVPRIVSELLPESVCDLGCGNGLTLKKFVQHGRGVVKEVYGYDGNNMSPEDYLINTRHLSLNQNFCDPGFILDKKYDLVVTLEVAEHIDNKFSDKFVDLCTMGADAILFSAALIGQVAGTHINNQPGWFWREKFMKRGFLEIDFIRPQIAFNPEFHWPYRQNITFFVHIEKLNSSSQLLSLYNKYRQKEGPERIVPIAEGVLENILTGRYQN